MHDLKRQWYQIPSLGARGKFFTLILGIVGYTDVLSAGWTAERGSLMCMAKGWLGKSSCVRKAAVVGARGHELTWHW